MFRQVSLCELDRKLNCGRLYLNCSKALLSHCYQIISGILIVRRWLHAIFKEAKLNQDFAVGAFFDQLGQIVHLRIRTEVLAESLSWQANDILFSLLPKVSGNRKSCNKNCCKTELTLLISSTLFYHARTKVGQLLAPPPEIGRKPLPRIDRSESRMSFHGKVGGLTME